MKASQLKLGQTVRWTLGPNPCAGTVTKLYREDDKTWFDVDWHDGSSGDGYGDADLLEGNGIVAHELPPVTKLTPKDRAWYREQGLLQEFKDEFRSNCTFQEVAEKACAWQREQDAQVAEGELLMDVPPPGQTKKDHGANVAREIARRIRAQEPG